MVPLARSPTPDTMTFMTAILDHRSRTTDQILKTSMALSTDPPSSAIEPLPHINYFLVNHLIRLARPHITKHQLKRVEYVVDARRSFYEGHAKFQIAYRDLLDAYACAQTLEKKHDELKNRLEDTLALLLVPADVESDQTATTVALLRSHIAAIEIQRRDNNDDMRIRLEALNTKAKSRQHVSAWFSQLKVVFLRDEMPWLIALTKHLYRAAMSQQKEQQKQQGSASSTSAAINTTQLGAVAGSSASAPHTRTEHLADAGEWFAIDDDDRDGEMEMQGFGNPFSDDCVEDDNENEGGGEGGMF